MPLANWLSSSALSSLEPNSARRSIDLICPELRSTVTVTSHSCIVGLQSEMVAPKAYAECLMS